jgi:hypothetical protein
MGSANYVRGLSGQTSIGPTTGAAADWGLLINATSTQARIDFETWSGGTGTLSGYIASLTANAMVLNHTNNVQLSVAGVPIAAAGASYFYPATDNSFDLGFSSGAFRWRNVYAMTGNFSTAVTVNGAITSKSATAGVGYETGAGSAVTQITSKATATPAINKVCGAITMNNAALAAGAKVSFVVTNSTVAATDTIIVSVASGGTANAYRAAVTAIAAGVSFTITVENITAGSLSEAPVINFAIIKAVAA